MDVDQQRLPVVGAQRADAGGDLRQFLLVAVRGFAVGDVEDHRREAPAVFGAAAPPLDEVVDIEQGLVHRGLARCGGSDPFAQGHLVEGGLSVGQAAFDADPTRVARGVFERRDRHERLVGREERPDALAE